MAIDTTGFALAGTGGGGGVLRSVQATTGVCPLPLTRWRKKPVFWPVDTLTLGSQSYNPAELLTILNTPFGAEGEADVSLILAYQLIASELDIANASDPSPVISTIDDADALLSRFPGKLPYMVKRSTLSGQAMFNDATVLTDYNHGNLTFGCGP